MTFFEDSVETVKIPSKILREAICVDTTKREGSSNSEYCLVGAELDEEQKEEEQKNQKAEKAQTLLRLLISLLVPRKHSNAALGSILSTILTHTTEIVEKLINDTDTNDFIRDADVANACSMIPFVSDVIALMSVHSQDTAALRCVLPAISKLLSALSKARGLFTSKLVQETDETICEVERASHNTSNGPEESISLNLASKIIPSYFWVYKPRNAENSVRVAFPANTSEQIENAYISIADLTPSELRERGGSLFHFDYLGEDAIALLSTAVPPGIGLQTTQFYRHCWGMRQQDGRDLIRLSGRDAVTAANAVFKSRRTDTEIRFELESGEESKEQHEEKKVKEEIALPETYMVLASLADAGSCASVRFICGSKNVLGEKHVDTFQLVRNGITMKSEDEKTRSLLSSILSNDETWKHVRAWLHKGSKKLKKKNPKSHEKFERAYMTALLWHTSHMASCEISSILENDGTATDREYQKKIANTVWKTRKHLSKLKQLCT